MKGDRLFDLLSELPDDLIDEAETVTYARPKPHILKWAALAACMAIAIFAGATLLNPNNTKSDAPAAAPAETPAEAPSDAFDSAGTAEPESAPAETPAEAPEAPAETGGGDYGGSNGLTGTASGFWEPYSLTSTAVTLYTPIETGWTALTVTDEASIDGLYDCLYVANPVPLDTAASESLSVLIDLQNGCALSLTEGEENVATLYTVPDEPALTAAMEADEDPVPYLTVTDPAVRYSTNLTDYVDSLRQ